MNNIETNNIPLVDNYSMITDTNAPVHSLPSELLQQIFSFLNPTDRQISVQVSTKWANNILLGSKNEVVAFAQDHIERLKSNLNQDKFKDMFENCHNLLFNFKQQVPQNLLQLKKALKIFQFDLAFELREIENVYPDKKSKFFDDFDLILFAFTRLHFAEISAESNPKISSDYLKFAFRKLAELNYIDRLKTLLGILPANLNKEIAYIELACALKNRGELEQAAELVVLLNDDFEKTSLKLSLTNAFLAKGNIDRAIDMIKTINNDDDDYAKNNLVKKVVEIFLKKGEYDLAIESFKALAPNSQSVLYAIANFLIEKQEFALASKVAKIAIKATKNNYQFSNIPEYIDKKLFEVVSKLALAKDYEGSFDIAYHISNEFKRGEAYKFIGELRFAR